MNYKERIAAHLRAALDAGLTQAELARELDFNNPNLISMHLDPNSAISPFPLKRIPALAQHCGLTDEESLGLINARAVCHPASATEVDQPTLTFVLRCGITALHARRSKAELAHVC
jgi:hypothetical protein